jgi:hypothetical protein
MEANITKSTKPTCEHISWINQVNHMVIENNSYVTRFQLKFKNWKLEIGWETIKQVTNGTLLNTSYSIVDSTQQWVEISKSTVVEIEPWSP